MEVILIQDVKSLGKKGELVKVKDNYAKNYLIPKKLGLEANNKNLNDLRLKKKNEDKLAQEQYDAAALLGEKIEQSQILVRIKAGDGGRTFGSISTKEIAKEMEEQLQIQVDKKKIMLSEPIKNMGNTLVPIKLHPKVTSNITVKVIEG